MMKLKPCPFCGLKPELMRGSSGWYVECLTVDCLIVRTPGETRKSTAIKKWNAQSRTDAKILEVLKKYSHYLVDGKKTIDLLMTLVEQEVKAK